MIKDINAKAVVYGNDTTGEVANASWRLVAAHNVSGNFLGYHATTLSQYYYHNKATTSLIPYNSSLPLYSNPTIPKGTTATLYFEIDAYDRARPNNIVAFYLNEIKAVGVTSGKNLSVNLNDQTGLLGYRMISK